MAVAGGLIGFLPPVASAAIVGAAIILFVLLGGFAMWKDDGLRIAELSGRNTQAFRLHVQDLHNYAKDLRDYVTRFSTPQRVPLSDPTAAYLRAHFPEAATAVDALNDGLDQQDETFAAFHTACKQHAANISGHIEPDVTDFLLAMAQQQSVAIDDLDFDLRGGNLVVALPNAPARIYTVAALPLLDSSTNLDLLSQSVGDAIRAVRQDDATTTFRSRPDLRPTKAAVHAALREALLDHDPPGECPKCPSAPG